MLLDEEFEVVVAGAVPCEEPVGPKVDVELDIG